MDTSFMQPVPSPGFNQSGLEMGPRLDPKIINSGSGYKIPPLPTLPIPSNAGTLTVCIIGLFCKVKLYSFFLSILF